MAVEVVLLLFSQHEPEVAWKYENFVRSDDLNLANAGIFKALIFLIKHIIVTRFVLTDDWLLVVARHIVPLDTCTDGQENSNKSGGQKYRIKFSCHLIPAQMLRKEKFNESME